ncbi:dienelactone hydrolase family protein [Subtercola boreus]|uniref:dienelactone hydrolase family protein n=1 Tax=Subtercola boreus TaxID=120213 RepID=UPI00117344B8|nr:dienelactone hydrolase family protein [Subtercola boreus]TQL52990.1 carboxymethylenebutenolidase [Subtercola boreus]
MSQLVTLSAAGTDFTAYVATPKGAPEEYRGAIIVIHEVWGLVDEIRNVADRYAAEGYLAIAPDLMGELGVSADEADDLQVRLVSTDHDELAAAQVRLRELMAPITAPAFATRAIHRLIATIDHLHRQTAVAGRIAVTGFSFGGSYAFSLAVADPRVRASLPFYAYANLPGELLAEIACPILYFVGEDDPALFAALPALTEQMKAAHVDFTAIAYRNAGHAFFNESNTHAYRKDAAKDAWKKSLAFLAENLHTAR